MLLDKIWGIDVYVEDRIVDSHMKSLRKKDTKITSQQLEGWGIELIRKIKTNLTLKIFFIAGLLLVFVCLIYVLSMVQYVPFFIPVILQNLLLN